MIAFFREIYDPEFENEETKERKINSVNLQNRLPEYQKSF